MTERDRIGERLAAGDLAQTIEFLRVFVDQCHHASHFDNQDLNTYPLTFAAGDFPEFREQWDTTSLTRSWNTSINLPYAPPDLAGILAGILENAGVEIRYSCPAESRDTGSLCTLATTETATSWVSPQALPRTTSLRPSSSIPSSLREQGVRRRSVHRGRTDRQHRRPGA